MVQSGDSTQVSKPSNIGLKRWEKQQQWVIKNRKHLGEGAFSVVKEGLNTVNQRRVAVKILDKTKHYNAAQHLAEEVGILRKISDRITEDANIIKFYDAYEDSQNVYVVTELCTGKSMQQLLDFEKQLDLGVAVGVVRQLLVALKELHSTKIVHRDIKPANLMYLNKLVTSPVKLVDFGFAKSLASPPDSQKVGSDFYVAPEVTKYQHYSPACDIWMVGVLLYNLLAGTYPFPNEQAALLGSFKFNGSVWGLEGYSRAQEFIKQILVTNPIQRPSATQLLKMHDRWLVTLSWQSELYLFLRMRTSFTQFQAFRADFIRRYPDSSHYLPPADANPSIDTFTFTYPAAHKSIDRTNPSSRRDPVSRNASVRNRNAPQGNRRFPASQLSRSRDQSGQQRSVSARGMPERAKPARPVMASTRATAMEMYRARRRVGGTGGISNSVGPRGGAEGRAGRLSVQPENSIGEDVPAALMNQSWATGLRGSYKNGRVADMGSKSNKKRGTEKGDSSGKVGGSQGINDSPSETKRSESGDGSAVLTPVAMQSYGTSESTASNGYGHGMGRSIGGKNLAWETVDEEEDTVSEMVKMETPKLRTIAPKLPQLPEPEATPRQPTGRISEPIVQRSSGTSVQSLTVSSGGEIDGMGRVGTSGEQRGVRGLDAAQTDRQRRSEVQLRQHGERRIVEECDYDIGSMKTVRTPLNPDLAWGAAQRQDGQQQASRGINAAWAQNAYNTLPPSLEEREQQLQQRGRTDLNVVDDMYSGFQSGKLATSYAPGQDVNSLMSVGIKTSVPQPPSDDDELLLPHDKQGVGNDRSDSRNTYTDAITSPSNYVTTDTSSGRRSQCSEEQSAGHAGSGISTKTSQRNATPQIEDVSEDDQRAVVGGCTARSQTGARTGEELTSLTSKLNRFPLRSSIRADRTPQWAVRSLNNGKARTKEEAELAREQRRESRKSGLPECFGSSSGARDAAGPGGATKSYMEGTKSIAGAGAQRESSMGARGSSAVRGQASTSRTSSTLSRFGVGAGRDALNKSVSMSSSNADKTSATGTTASKSNRESVRYTRKVASWMTPTKSYQQKLTQEEEPNHVKSLRQTAKSARSRSKIERPSAARAPAMRSTSTAAGKPRQRVSSGSGGGDKKLQNQGNVSETRKQVSVLNEVDEGVVAMKPHASYGVIDSPRNVPI